MTNHPSRILKAALADPFVFPEDDFGSDPIFKWYELALREAPLWCFDARTFNRLNGPGSLSTHPLRTILDRILADEGLDRQTLGMVGEPIRNLLARRSDLSGGNAHPAACHVVDNRIHTRSMGLFGDAYQLPDDVDWDDDGPIGSHSPYEDLGREFASFLEVLQAAGYKERASRQDEIDRFLESVGARPRSGRPIKGASATIVQALFQEGMWLTEVAWPCGPVVPTERVGHLLSTLPQSEQALWCRRLALPFFSTVEIDALLSQVEAPRVGSRRPSPRRFVVWCLSHRLGV